MGADWSKLMRGQHLSIIIVNYVPLQVEVDIIKLQNKTFEGPDVDLKFRKFFVFNRYSAVALGQILKSLNGIER